jgi:hypothetical protein
MKANLQMLCRAAPTGDSMIVGAANWNLTDYWARAAQNDTC